MEDNMIPIYYSESDNNWHKADVTNSDPNNRWYDYDQKMWANAATIYNEPNYYTEKITEKEVSFENKVTITDGYINENKNAFEGEDYSSNTIFTFTTGSTGGKFSFDYFISDPSTNYLDILVNDTWISDLTGTAPLISGTYSINAEPNTNYTIDITYEGYISTSPNGYAAIGDFVLPDNLKKQLTISTNDSSNPFVKTSQELIGPSRTVYQTNNFDEYNGYFLTEPTNDLSVGIFICSDFTKTEECKEMYEIKEITGNMITKVNSYEMQTMREYYQNASVGAIVSMNDINTMWTWIPRYKYTYFKGQTKCSTLTNPNRETNKECYEYVYQDSFHDELSNQITNDISDDPAIIEEIITSWKNGERDNYYGFTFEEFANPENGNTTLDLSTFHPEYSLNKTPVEIKISFEKGTSSTGTIKCTDAIVSSSEKSENCADTTNGGLVVGKSTYTHPAFTFGNEELTGIWVGKFETSATHIPTSTSTELRTVIIKPDEESWRYTALSYFVNSTRNMELSNNEYGFPQTGTILNTYTGEITGDSNNLDTHVMKNIEWGAVAYLSHSKYGKNSEIFINNSGIHESTSTYYPSYTGRSGGNVGGSTPMNGTYKGYGITNQNNAYGFYTYDGYLLNYNTNEKSTTRDLSKVASTTGNIYGIYDMSGGSYEYVMANMRDERNSFYPVNAGTWSSTNKPLDKYYDKYSYSKDIYNYTHFTVGKLGDATIEMQPDSTYDDRTWYEDYAVMPADDYPYIIRGGVFKDKEGSGIFSFEPERGSAYKNYGYRVTLTIEPK